jgi:nucleotide-binding universal stress UspA family protein
MDKSRAAELQMTKEEAERENLEKYAERIAELRSVRHKDVALIASPWDAIHSASRVHRIDLLVLGSRGRRGLPERSLGSVAEWAIRRLVYPVLITGPKCVKTFRPIKSIVLATDLSIESARLVPYARSLLQDNGALTVQHVVSRPGASGEQPQDEVDLIRQLAELLPAGCEEWCSPEYQVRKGNIAPEIVGAANESRATLIVLGSRYRSASAERGPLNIVADVIRSARCPVLVVPISETGSAFKRNNERPAPFRH